MSMRRRPWSWNWIRRSPVARQPGTRAGGNGKLEEGIEHYRKALELDPGHPEAHNDLGSALVRSRRLPEAVEQFEKALQSSPDHPGARAYLGAALAQMGRIDRPMPHWKERSSCCPKMRRRTPIWDWRSP